MRDWVQKVLSSSGRERLTKNDLDYWLGSRQILKAATTRIRALKPLIELLAVPNPLAESAMAGAGSFTGHRSYTGNDAEGIAETAESYAGSDSISVIKQFSPPPLRQTDFFKLNKKHSAEIGWSSCCVNTFATSAPAKLAIGPSSRRSMRHAAFSQTERSGLFFSSRQAEVPVAKELAADLYELEQKQEASESGGAVMYKILDDLRRG